jgi:hypothetical protein
MTGLLSGSSADVGQTDEMAFDVRPASEFDDVSVVIGPKRPDANVCWCLSYRIPSKLNKELQGKARGKYVAELCDRDLAPGVIAYDGDEPVGWAGVAPRSELNSFARKNSKIPHLDDQPVWTVWCFRTVAGNRGRASPTRSSPVRWSSPATTARR